MQLMSATSTSNVYFGTLLECQARAKIDGLTLENSQGRVLAMDGGKTLYASSPITTYWYDKGLIIKGQDDWCLVSQKS